MSNEIYFCLGGGHKLVYKKLKDLLDQYKTAGLLISDQKNLEDSVIHRTLAIGIAKDDPVTYSTWAE